MELSYQTILGNCYKVHFGAPRHPTGEEIESVMKKSPNIHEMLDQKAIEMIGEGVLQTVGFYESKK